MAESNDWTQVRKCEASLESKWNSYQEKLQKEAQDRARENHSTRVQKGHSISVCQM